MARRERASSEFLLGRVLLLVLLVVLAGCDRDESAAGGVIAGPGDSENGPLPTLGQVPPFELTDQNGRPFGSKNLNGQPYVVAFMFTRCPSICPTLTATMKRVDGAVKAKKKQLSLVSISVDPKHDGPDVLLAYAKKHGADVSNWTFLTGAYETVAKTSEDGFKIGLTGSIDESKPHLGITHGSHLVLVDGKGNIRGYFSSSSTTVSEEIVAALERL